MPSQNRKRRSSGLIPTEKSYLLGKDVSHKQSFKAWNRLYDIITMCITIMDLLTDILLMSQFYYSSNGMTFFWFSLSFILLTHICYVILTLVKFGLSLSTIQQIICFCCLLPISPFLPYVIYAASWPDSWITINIIDRFGLERINCWDPDHSYRLPPWKRFVSEKLVTNVAFICESFLESFPLSIIQIIAIVSFQEYKNPIYLSSISFSLLSIVWKSILVASGASISSSVYKWLCFVTDFYSTLFVCISWAFLSIQTSETTEYHDNDFFGLLNISGAMHMSLLGYIYVYKVLFLVSPLIIFVVMLLIFELSIDSIHDFLCWKSRSFVLLIVCYVPFVIIVVVIVVLLSLILALLAGEFMMFSWSAWFVEMFFNQRYKWLDKPMFWDIIINNFLLIDGLNNKKDLILRLCIVNYILSQTTESEWVKRMFIDFNSFMTINEYKVFHDPKYKMTLNTLRNQFGDSKCRSARTMFGCILRDYMDHVRNLQCFSVDFFVNCTYFLILFIGIPLYILSRIITLLYPFCCVIYLLIYNINIPIFCCITTFIYCILILILLIIGSKLYRLMNILWHIMPGREKLVKSLIVDKPDLDYLTQLNAMYYFHMNRPRIYAILVHKFSNDVATIITMYTPRTYYEECKLYKTGSNHRKRKSKKRRKLRNNNYLTYSTYSNTPSSSPHLAIDCVDPLPPTSRYCSAYSSLNNSPNNKDDNIFAGTQINMTVPQFAIPDNCIDPLSLLNSHK